MKRIYIKPESFLLDENCESMLLTLSGTNTTDANGNSVPGGPVTGGNGDGTDINGARGYSFFEDDDF